MKRVDREGGLVRRLPGKLDWMIGNVCKEVDS